MYRIKDLCEWYQISHEALHRKLLAEGILTPEEARKKGPRTLSLSQLQPFFKKYGQPKGLTLALGI